MILSASFGEAASGCESFLSQTKAAVKRRVGGRRKRQKSLKFSPALTANKKNPNNNTLLCKTTQLHNVFWLPDRFNIRSNTYDLCCLVILSFYLIITKCTEVINVMAVNYHGILHL